MDRREKLLTGLNVREMVGVEIGPLASPFVRKEEDEIIYVDYIDGETLRKKYKDDPNVDTTKIVEPDAIWGTLTLQQAIGEERRVDYIVASHVIEHVPDLLTWLEELRSVLRENGQLRLIVPDRRFTFDYLRRESQLPEVLYCHLIRARVPQAFFILDFFINFVQIDKMDIWNGTLNPAEVKRHIAFEAAYEAAREAVERGSYRDVHCWVFTPRSFVELFAQLAEYGFIEFACEQFYDTEYGQHDFFLVLQPSTDKCHIVDSWHRMAVGATVEPPRSIQPAPLAL